MRELKWPEREGCAHGGIDLIRRKAAACQRQHRRSQAKSSMGVLSVEHRGLRCASVYCIVSLTGIAQCWSSASSL